MLNLHCSAATSYRFPIVIFSHTNMSPEAGDSQVVTSYYIPYILYNIYHIVSYIIP